jgi:hypothetical protein
MGDVARPAVSLGNGERLHQVPSREIGAGDVADFAAPHQIVQRIERLFDGRLRVEAVHVVEIDVIGAEPAQAGFAGFNQMMAGGADLVGTVAHLKCRFGGDQDRIAPPGDGLAQNLLGRAFGIHVGGIEEIDSSFQANIYEVCGFLDIAASPGFEEFPAASESAGAEAENRDFESRVTELAEFHRT